MFKSSIPSFGKEDIDEAQWLTAILLELQILTHRPLQLHQNIIDLFCVGWEGDASHRSRKWPVLTVEYANRGTLDDYFDYDTSPSFSPKNAICCDVRNGLQALHDCNVVHEDLKFPNVLVFSSNDERPVIAKLSGFSSALLDTRAMTSLSFASRPWNAPEWDTASPRNLLIKSDVYTFDLLTWRVMINGLNSFEDKVLFPELLICHV